MTDLHAMQQQFLAQMVSPEAPDNSTTGLQAYRDAYLLRIDEALRTDFDAVHQILGDDDMLALTSDYIEQYPSRHPSIRWIGRSLPQFIADSTHWSRLPLLPAVARFEWAKSCLFDQENSPIATLEDLQAIAPELWGDMRLELISALTLESLPANVPPICQQLGNRENISSPSAEPNEPWLLWRKEMVVHWRSLDEIERLALKAVLSGATFAELCQQMTSHLDEDQVPTMAMQLLLQWCNDQIISHFHP